MIGWRLVPASTYFQALWARLQGVGRQSHPLAMDCTRLVCLPAAAPECYDTPLNKQGHLSTCDLWVRRLVRSQPHFVQTQAMTSGQVRELASSFDFLMGPPGRDRLSLPRTADGTCAIPAVAKYLTIAGRQNAAGKRAAVFRKPLFIGGAARKCSFPSKASHS